MKRSVAFAVAALATMLSVGVAVATPGTGATSSIIARAPFDAISSSQTAGLDGVIQELTIAPGGYTGWHTHPGPTFVIVESGTITLYNHACQGTDHVAGLGFIEEPGEKALARNNTDAPVTVTVVYLDVPVGGGVRADATAPACADAGNHDLPTTATGSGLTPAILSRANFATAAGIVGADGRDLVVQTSTIAPAGHSGWHSHPGSAMVFVKSGTLKLYNAATCTAQPFGPGQGWVEEVSDIQLGRNEGSVPLVLYNAFFDVPAGGSNRVDQPEPSNCQGLAAVPAAAPVASAPNTAALAATGSPSSAPSLAFLLIALAACLVSVGLLRARQRR